MATTSTKNTASTAATAPVLINRDAAPRSVLEYHQVVAYYTGLADACKNEIAKIDADRNALRAKQSQSGPQDFERIIEAELVFRNLKTRIEADLMLPTKVLRYLSDAKEKLPQACLEYGPRDDAGKPVGIANIEKTKFMIAYEGDMHPYLAGPVHDLVTFPYVHWRIARYVMPFFHLTAIAKRATENGQETTSGNVVYFLGAKGTFSVLGCDMESPCSIAFGIDRLNENAPSMQPWRRPCEMVVNDRSELGEFYKSIDERQFDYFYYDESKLGFFKEGTTRDSLQSLFNRRYQQGRNKKTGATYPWRVRIVHTVPWETRDPSKKVTDFYYRPSVNSDDVMDANYLQMVYGVEIVPIWRVIGVFVAQSFQFSIEASATFIHPSSGGGAPVSSDSLLKALKLTRATPVLTPALDAPAPRLLIDNGVASDTPITSSSVPTITSSSSDSQVFNSTAPSNGHGKRTMQDDIVDGDDPNDSADDYFKSHGIDDPTQLPMDNTETRAKKQKIA